MRSRVVRTVPACTCFDPCFSQRAAALLRMAERVGGRRLRRRRGLHVGVGAARQTAVRTVVSMRGLAEDCGQCWLGRPAKCLPLALLRLADVPLRLRLSCGFRRFLRNDARCGVGSAQSVRNMAGVQRLLRQLGCAVDVVELGGNCRGSNARLWRLGAAHAGLAWGRWFGVQVMCTSTMEQWCWAHLSRRLWGFRLGCVLVLRGVRSGNPLTLGPKTSRRIRVGSRVTEIACRPRSRAASSEERKWALWLNNVKRRCNVPEAYRAAWEGSCPELFDVSGAASALTSVDVDVSDVSAVAAQQGLASGLSEQQKRCLALTRLPVNPGLCVARTWRGAQCTNRRSKRSEYCAQHARLPVLKEGRYDCELSEETALAYARKAASFVRPFVCRFYCRTKDVG